MKTLPIKDFPGYYAREDGVILSDKSGELKELATWHGKNSLYKMVGLVKRGKRHRLLVHRLIAQTFIPNPDNLPVVNHKDADRQNCDANNLEWVTAQQNMADCFTRHSPVRNFRKCKLYKDNVFVDEFQSVKAAIRYAAKEYHISPTMLEKHRHHKNISIEV